jgi:hypothetical protein
MKKSYPKSTICTAHHNSPLAKGEYKGSMIIQTEPLPGSEWLVVEYVSTVDFNQSEWDYINGKEDTQ